MAGSAGRCYCNPCSPGFRVGNCRPRNIGGCGRPARIPQARAHMHQAQSHPNQSRLQSMRIAACPEGMPPFSLQAKVRGKTGGRCIIYAHRHHVSISCGRRRRRTVIRFREILCVIIKQAGGACQATLRQGICKYSTAEQVAGGRMGHRGGVNNCIEGRFVPGALGLPCCVQTAVCSGCCPPPLHHAALAHRQGLGGRVIRY